ncbi:multicopper oxidase family protein [Bradyrhizobium sp. STM 3557]|uniref:multicopper oxidase family protein n=1 Tax=Bradyrhizobium sp. STM 3557 TaxID=578920 RepID=UPI00388E80F2
MSDSCFSLHRRALLAGLGASGAAALLPVSVRAAESASLAVTAKAGTIALRSGQAASPAWALETSPAPFRVKRGTTLDMVLANELPLPVAFSWRGLGRSVQMEPMAKLAAGAHARLVVPASQAGTGLCDIRPLADGGAAPTRPLPLIVDENEPVNVDHDEVFLIEDWRVTGDGAALPPGVDPKGAETIFTVNGAARADIAARGHQRLRLRLINGCQRAVIAIKIADIDVRVMAMDGQPAEPFSARNGAVVLPPGGRTDVFIDVPPTPGATKTILLYDGTTARPVGSLIIGSEPPIRPAPLSPAPPLPSNGLPDRLDLKSALRIELPLGGADWVSAQRFSTSAPPAFQAKAGRTIMLALTNRTQTAMVFHLRGYSFRLLDRLDDGWKPYWLDTLALEPGQTQRVAFAAENPGRFLIESTAIDWAAPRLVRWFELS